MSSAKISPADLIAVPLICGGSIILPMALMAWSNLNVTVQPEAVSLRFAPYHRTVRRYPISSIESAVAVQYRPIADFGGWGLRRNRGGDVIYNVKGDRAVVLTFKDGKKLFIGSQRPDELAAEISKLLKGR
jgi:hypothetical protein